MPYFCHKKNNMETSRNNRRQAKTKYIQLDTKKCEACWKCMEVCPNNVFGRINLPWHKHVKLKNISDCTGCLKCVNVCASNAINKRMKEKADKR